MAAAIVNQTWTENRLDQSFFESRGNRVAVSSTEGRRTVPHANSSFASAPQPQTNSAENPPKQVLGTTVEPSETISPTLELAGLRSIDCVISEIRRDTVKIKCKGATGDTELQLPPSLIPNALMHVGQPIVISLDSSDGYRRPVINARAIGPQAKLPGQDEFESWAKSI
jgi:hypothetical protein